LPDDEMLGAGMSLGANRRNDLTAARVKRIDDLYFNRQTPGSMPLLRPAAAKAIWRQRSAISPPSTATKCASPRPPIW
jgi:hypothetical protein